MRLSDSTLLSHLKMASPPGGDFIVEKVVEGIADYAVNSGLNPLTLGLGALQELATGIINAQFNPTAMGINAAVIAGNIVASPAFQGAITGAYHNMMRVLGYPSGEAAPMPLTLARPRVAPIILRRVNNRIQEQRRVPPITLQRPRVPPITLRRPRVAPITLRRQPQTRNVNPLVNLATPPRVERVVTEPRAPLRPAAPLRPLEPRIPPRYPGNAIHTLNGLEPLRLRMPANIRFRNPGQVTAEIIADAVLNRNPWMVTYLGAGVVGILRQLPRQELMDYIRNNVNAMIPRLMTRLRSLMRRDFSFTETQLIRRGIKRLQSLFRLVIRMAGAKPKPRRQEFYSYL